MQFTKIRHNKNVELHWKEDGEQRTLVCDQEPTPEFQKGIAAFGAQFLDVCALPRGSEIEVHTVTISHDEDTGSRRMVVSATRTVPAGSYSVSSPSLQERTDLAKAPTHKNIPDSWLTLLDELEGLAKGYLKGERAQVSAELGGNGSDSSDEKHGAQQEIEGMPAPAKKAKKKGPSKQSRRTGRRD